MENILNSIDLYKFKNTILKAIIDNFNELCMDKWSNYVLSRIFHLLRNKELYVIVDKIIPNFVDLGVSKWGSFVIESFLKSKKYTVLN